MGAIKWQRSSTTPSSRRRCGCGDLLAGHLLFVAIRLSISAGVFLVVMGLFSAPSLGLGGALACRSAVLTGMAFATPIFAFAATRDTDSGFAMLFRFGIVPMFLFSGTFFPVSQLPDWLEPVAYAVPLWHGVDLCRDLALGSRVLLGRSRARRLPAALGRSPASSVALRAFDEAAARRDDAPTSLPSSLRLTPPGLPRLLGTGGAWLPRRAQRARLPARAGWCCSPASSSRCSTCSRVGVGVAQLVGDIALPGGQVVTYTAFIAPAMLAASAMNGAIYDATFNIFFKLKYDKLYDAVLATPVTPVDVAVGEITWALMRGSFYSISFVGVMLLMGLISSWWAVLALPVVVLIGFAFAAVGMACTTYMRSWQDFEYVTLVHAADVPVLGDVLPAVGLPRVAAVGRALSPLYHAATLLRELTTGTVGLGSVRACPRARRARAGRRAGHRPAPGEAAAHLGRGDVQPDSGCCGTATTASQGPRAPTNTEFGSDPCPVSTGTVLHLAPSVEAARNAAVPVTHVAHMLPEPPILTCTLGA